MLSFDNKPLGVRLDSIYSLISTNLPSNYNLEEACNQIFDLIGDLLDEYKFKEVDYVLKTVDFNKLESYSIVSFLSIMHPYDRSKLNNWKEFYDKARIQLLKTEKTEVEVEKLLRGFEKDPPVGRMNILNYF